eukprot:NODE_825_length_1427_cov_50.341074_g320_i1.p1 GENE.NODE_825_length_1427_cov_50.341074_g320_i1~~NODE_825_length_1427_cov_50.341074_g320_i1.p1  ORF type:complete len:170 (+),score=26.49 NODE_825_length_1427_cov_50.341074_g320_i1:782-1291(+)
MVFGDGCFCGKWEMGMHFKPRACFRGCLTTMNGSDWGVLLSAPRPPKLVPSEFGSCPSVLDAFISIPVDSANEEALVSVQQSPAVVTGVEERWQRHKEHFEALSPTSRPITHGMKPSFVGHNSREAGTPKAKSVAVAPPRRGRARSASIYRPRETSENMTDPTNPFADW